MDTQMRDLAQFLVDQDVQAPDAVALLTRMAGEIMRMALDEGETTPGEVEFTIVQAAGNMRRRAGIGAGNEAH